MVQLDERALRGFETYLRERENSPATVRKYLHDVGLLAEYCSFGQLTEKVQLIAFKAELQRRYKPSSVNSMLAAVNQFLCYAGSAWRLRFLKVQRRTYAAPDRELTAPEYERLVTAAERRGDKRLALLLQIMGSTGIRVSELQYITVEAARAGRAEIALKGKIREILLPRKLCRKLRDYCREHSITSGPVMISRSGRALDRSNVWKMIKRLARAAKVDPEKAFPHNLRHLFARTFYKRTKDIVRLADLLGHSSVDTTRIYTVRTSQEQKAQLDGLPLLL